MVFDMGVYVISIACMYSYIVCYEYCNLRFGSTEFVVVFSGVSFLSLLAKNEGVNSWLHTVWVDDFIHTCVHVVVAWCGVFLLLFMGSNGYFSHVRSDTDSLAVNREAQRKATHNEGICSPQDLCIVTTIFCVVHVQWSAAEGIGLMI